MLPALIYGTAWKEDDTERLVSLALETGFRGIDTANQRKHYHEAQVGNALTAAFGRGLRRDEVFVQTKFTFLAGQDQRLPYDPKASIGTQVEQSFAASLAHLGLATLDSYVLHGPSRREGWNPEDAEVRAFCRQQGVRYQPFSLLTGNPQVVTSPVLREVATRVGRTPAQVVFRFASDVGMLPLTGTSDPQHMKEDLSLDFTLTAEELARIDRVWK